MRRIISVVIIFLFLEYQFHFCAEFDPKVEQKPHKQMAKKNYSLDDNLRIELNIEQHTSQNINAQLEILRFNVSVNTNSQCGENNCDDYLKIFNNKRAAFDFVILIDNSGSQNNFQLVQDSVKLLISQFMNKYDRISLITFNSNPQILTNFIPTLEENKMPIFFKIINSIAKGGSTNLISGFQSALYVLKNRKYKNPVTKIFLFTDGKDINQRMTDDIFLNYLLLDTLRNEKIQVDIFSFSDHSVKLLSEIAEMSGGQYYQVKSDEENYKPFINSFIDVISHVAKNTELNINLNKPIFEEYFDTYHLSTDVEYDYKIIKRKEKYQINIGVLKSSTQKHFYFDLSVPKFQSQKKCKAQLIQNMISVEVKTQDIKTQEFTSIKKNVPLLIQTCEQSERF